MINSAGWEEIKEFYRFRGFGCGEFGSGDGYRMTWGWKRTLPGRVVDKFFDVVIIRALR